MFTVKYNLLLNNINSNSSLTIANKVLSNSDYVNYILLNFLLIIVLIIVSNITLLLVNNLILECDIGHTTPEDFCLLIGNLPLDFAKEGFDKDSFIKVNNILPVDINYTYKLTDFYKKQKKLNNLRKKLVNIEKYIVKNYNKEKTTLNTLYHEVNTNSNILDIVKKNDKYVKVKLEYDKINKDLKKQINKTNNNKQDNFSGTIIATFNTIEESDKYLINFPNSFISNLYNRIKILFNRCKKSKIYSDNIDNNNNNTYYRNIKCLEVKRAPNPYDIIWENLEYTSKQRKIRRATVFLISFVILIISFLIILGLNYIQNNLSYLNTKFNFDIKTDNFEKYQFIISIVISLIILTINFIFKKILFMLTLEEKSISTTNFNINYSIKLSLILFVNNAVIPLISNIINGHWDNKHILINNVFTILVSNAFVSPMIWLLNINLFILKFKRKLIVKLISSYNNILNKNSNNNNNDNKINTPNNNILLSQRDANE